MSIHHKSLTLILVTLMGIGVAQEERSSSGPPVSLTTVVFSNTNFSSVRRQPETETWFTISQPVVITQIETYHWPTSEAPAEGTISLRNRSGEIVGEWLVTGAANDSNSRAQVRIVLPRVALEPGEYVVVDSCPETWCWNEQSKGGMVQIRGLLEEDSADQSQPPAEGMNRLIVAGLQMDVQDSWEPMTSRSGTISYLRMKSAGHPEVKLEVVRKPSFDLLLGSLTERGADLMDFQQQTVAGRSATAYAYSDSQKKTTGLLLAFTDPLMDGTSAAVQCEAGTDDWDRISDLLKAITPSIRIAPDAPSQPTTEMPASVPSTGETPKSEPESVWSAPELTWDEPEHWYLQPAGQFRIRIPDGWFVEEGMRNKVADADFDSLKDPTGKFVMICCRKGSSVSSAERVLTRFAGMKLYQEKSSRTAVSFFSVGDAQAVRLAYFTKQTPAAAISRTGFVMKNMFFIINTVAPEEAGVESLPANLQEILDTLEFIPDPPSEPLFGPLGKELVDFRTLPGLTEDFGLTVFERGAVIHDMVHHLDIPFHIHESGHPVMAGCEKFLNSDPEKQQHMGEPLTGEMIVSDFRLCLQLFEGGFLIQDPLQQQIFLGTHPRRSP